jgi:hypothetical protein
MGELVRILRMRSSLLLAATYHRMRAHWPSTVLLGLVVAAGVYVIAYPFTVVTYPPLTDLPFHAAAISILRHYFDSAYHFRQQFELHFLSVPYATMYIPGAVLSLFMPVVWATKVMAVIMLAQLPCGMAVLFYGMRKSPLWGIWGLLPVWSLLTHWGFLNFMAAIGLFAMACGLTLLVLDRPTRGRQIALAVALLAVFLTHIYRFPFAIAAVIGITVLVYPSTRRVKPVLLPLAAALLVFGLWSLVRTPGLGGDLGPIAIHTERFAEIPDHLYGAFVGTEEDIVVRQMVWGAGGLWVVSALLFLAQGRFRHRGFRAIWWGASVTLLPILLGGVFLLAYLVLPMSIGTWWFVYPREITSAVFIALAAIPDLPRQWWLRVPMLGVVAVLAGKAAYVTAKNWDDFEAVNHDFREIMMRVPPAPRLMYLVFDHSGSTRRVTPFIHMPAWVQAEKGGWLSFHFSGWADLNPIRYRPPGPNIPPPTPPRWEWTPERFDLRSNGAFFDTFLIRNAGSPEHLFAGDSSIKPIDHIGKWWLYRRDPSNAPATSAAH